MNGGSCTDVNTCTCSTGYTGDVCETGMKSISKFIWIVVTNINNVHFVKSKKVCEGVCHIFVTFHCYASNFLKLAANLLPITPSVKVRELPLRV